MRYLGPLEAANEIRAQIQQDQASRVSPDAAHEMAFVKEVCRYLGIDASPENVQHVTLVLRERGVAIPKGQEYPKYVVRKSDNTQHVVHSHEEELTKIDEPAPELPASPPPPIVGEPVQFGNSDYSSDISDKVPRVVNRDSVHDVMARNQRHGDGVVPPSDISDMVPKTSSAGGKTELAKLTDHEAAQGQLPDGASPDNYDDGVVIDDGSAIVYPDAPKGVLAHDDADRDGIRGQDADPTHDNGFIRQDMKDGTINSPRPHSDEVSTDEVEKGKLKQPGNRKRPV